MSTELLNAFSIMVIIAVAYFFKRIKLLDISATKSLSRLALYLTLPCAILSKANDLTFDTSLFSIMFLVIGINAVMLFISFFGSRNPQTRMFYMINTTCFNIGNVVLPFVQDSLTSQAFLALCMFNVINALFAFGGCYSVALIMNRKHFPHLEVNAKTILIEMSKSLPSYAYALAMILAAFSLPIPDFLYAPIKTIGSANTLLCFTVIGIVLTFKIEKEQLRNVMGAWAMRYGMVISIALFIWFFLPYDADVRMILVIILMAPVTSLAPIMTMKAIPNYIEESGDVNTISIMTSLVLITVLNTLSPLLVADNSSGNFGTYLLSMF